MIALDVEEVPGKDVCKLSIFIASDRFKHTRGSVTHSCGGHDLVKKLLRQGGIDYHSLNVSAMSIEKYEHLEHQNQLHRKKPLLESNYTLVCSPRQMVEMFPEVSAVTPSAKKVSKALADITNLNDNEEFEPSTSSSPLAHSASSTTSASSTKADGNRESSAPSAKARDNSAAAAAASSAPSAKAGGNRESTAHSAAAASASQQKRNGSFPTSSAAARAVDTTMNASRDRAKKAKVEHPPVTAYEAWKRRNPSSGKWNKLSRDEKLRWASVAEKDTRQAAMQRDMFAPFKRQM